MSLGVVVKYNQKPHQIEG